MWNITTYMCYRLNYPIWQYIKDIIYDQIYDTYKIVHVGIMTTFTFGILNTFKCSYLSKILKAGRLIAMEYFLFHKTPNLLWHTFVVCFLFYTSVQQSSMKTLKWNHGYYYIWIHKGNANGCYKTIMLTTTDTQISKSLKPIFN